MSKVVKAAVLFGALSALAGCFLPNPQPEEIVIVEPVQAEPVSGKF